MCPTKPNCSLVTLVLAVFAIIVYPVHGVAQSQDLGERVYAKAAQSVVEVLTYQNGKLDGLGSGFVIEGGQVITNSHVVLSGELFVRIGPVRIPAKLLKRDLQNDLALLSTNAEISLPPLQFGNMPTPGTTVFAIGNPQGLEKSLSQGVVSAIRDFNGKTLLQVTTALSHGSSGGPILDRSGLVVGVSLGAIESGQSLNFAVPITVLRNFLKTEKTPNSLTEFMSRLDEIRARKGEVSLEEGSSWQNGITEELQVYRDAAAALAQDEQALMTLERHADEGSNYLGVAAVKAEVAKRKPTAKNLIALSEALRIAAYLHDPYRDTLLKASESNARKALAVERTADTLHGLGESLNAVEKYSEAELMFKQSLDVRTKSSEVTIARTWKGIYESQVGQGKFSEADRSFERLRSIPGGLDSADWASYGRSLESQRRYEAAAGALLEAYNLNNKNTYAICKAGSNFWVAGKMDEALTSSRRCLDEEKQYSDRAWAKARHAYAHEIISSILGERGVHESSLRHAREAIALEPEDAFAHHLASEALRNLGRNLEAVAEAKEALRLSDGGNAIYHFSLGAAYFELEQWKDCARAFELAAQLDKKNASAAYNVAICNARQRLWADAASWYEEVLRRSPNHPEAAEIRRRIQVLRK